MENIVSIISTLGFPIACCVVLFYMLHQEQVKHETEMKTLTEALNNNTNAINLLIAKIGGENHV